jgi:hypothetical protein
MSKYMNKKNAFIAVAVLRRKTAGRMEFSVINAMFVANNLLVDILFL